jgi:hypothetical protein
MMLSLSRHFIFAGKHISRRHCEFRRREEINGRSYWNICDLGSAGRTFVNGYPIGTNEEIGEYRLFKRCLILLLV